MHAATAILPAAAADYRIGGSVVVRVFVGSQGEVIDESVRVTADRRLDSGAIRAARASTYAPELKDCRPIRGEVLMTVTFPADGQGPQEIVGTGLGSASLIATSADLEVRLISKGPSAADALERARASYDSILRIAARFDAAPTAWSATSFRTEIADNDDVSPALRFTADRVVKLHYPDLTRVLALRDALKSQLDVTLVYVRYVAADAERAYEAAYATAESEALVAARGVATARHRKLGKPISTLAYSELVSASAGGGAGSITVGLRVTYVAP